MTFSIPDIFLTDAAKKKALWEYLVAHRLSCDTKKQPWNIGDRIIVLQGEIAGNRHDDCRELLTKEVKQIVVATIRINQNQDAAYGIAVQFDTGSGWSLHRQGYAVPLAVLEKYLEKQKVPTELNTSHLDKLVIDPGTKSEILSVLKQHKHMNKIFKEWGLDEVMEYGKAMSMLFYGPPGTGKTWGATCIAKALGKEVMVISAAEIQTSEPGGANRNIEAAFDQARKKDNVLFLDECDGLITDRSHVGMILASEINTLLTCLEKFEGVVIFATNRCDTLDPAMARRISLMVEFKNPDAKTRESIWEVLLPKKMPLAKDVSIKKLAKFDLTGGYIKNVILSAARTAAAEEAEAVTMKHFASAIKRIKDTKDIMGTHTSRQQDFVKARG